MSTRSPQESEPATTTSSTTSERVLSTASSTASSMASSTAASPRWEQSTKQIVGVVALVVLTIVLWRFRGLLTSVIVAALVAYLLSPVIEMLWQRTPLNRVLSVLVVFLVAGVFAVVVGWTLVTSGLTQLVALAVELPQDLYEWGSEQLEPYAVLTDENVLHLLPGSENSQEFDLNTVLDPAQNETLNDILSPSAILDRARAALLGTGSLALRVVRGAAGVLTNGLLILFLSIYLAKDTPRFRRALMRAAQSANYGHDADRLLSRFKRIWDAYLRGQLVLALVIFLIVGTALNLMGVANAWGLAVVAGVAEFLPIIGPTVSTGVAVLAALLQPALDASGEPTNALGLGPVGLAIAVFVLMFAVQQLEQAVLVPRIVGSALDLHPILVLTGVVMGTTIAGVLGAILAAPVLASVKLVGYYIWDKMLDQDPFPEDEPTPTASLSLPGWAWLRQRFATVKSNRGTSKQRAS